MTVRDIINVLTKARIDPAEYLRNEKQKKNIEKWVKTAQQDAVSLVPELVKLEQERDHAKKSCEKAAEAAGNLEKMLRDLLEGNRLLCRLETVRETLAGNRAVCRVNGHVRDLPIHPDLDVDELRTLQSWEYVAVNEQVVVDTWRDDPFLLNNAMGDVVDFRGYKDREEHQVRVATHGAEEKVVTLAPHLRDTELTPHTRLVLQRDDPHRAISSVPAAVKQSRFEVPVDKLETRLEDLAGIEEIAQQLLEDVLLRICHPEIRDEFNLDPLKGILLYSRPGMGKTAIMRAIARWLYDHREEIGYDVILYVIKPNETKSMWHGEDARIMREDLWGAVRARQTLPRTRPLLQILVFDEIDSLGKRAGGNEPQFSAAQSDALEALLVEMDGLIQEELGGDCAAHVLCTAMTNRPDRVDEAAKRPGRFDLVLPMPEVDIHSAEDVMAIYARGDQLPWHLDDQVQTNMDMDLIRTHFLRPAVARMFPRVVLRYKTDTQRSIDVTAGELLANVHYKDAMNRAKKRAALRRLHDEGITGIASDDVMDCLVNVACEAAQQMEADPAMLVRQMQIKVPVTTVDAVPREELQEHRYLRVASA
jgi:SpoVK/Ycf46/Vps4 family AAA+-type ATPase